MARDGGRQVMPVAIGLYLPLGLSVAIFLGASLARLMRRDGDRDSNSGPGYCCSRPGW